MIAGTLGFLFSLAACSATPTSPEPASSTKLESYTLEIVLSDSTLVVGQEVTVSATLTSDGGEVTEDAVYDWYISDPNVVSVYSHGATATLLAVGVGEADLSVSADRPGKSNPPGKIRKSLRLKTAASADEPDAPADPPADEPPVDPPADEPPTNPLDTLLQGDVVIGLHQDLTWNGQRDYRVQAIAHAKGVNARISRNSLLWHQIEPVKGNRNWSLVDAVVSELQAEGVEPLLALYGSPSWANGVPESVSDYYLYVPTDAAAVQGWIAEYADFAGELAARYRGVVTKWELWNEQNEHYFWKPRPDLTTYAAWFVAVSAAIRSADPNAEIALGGLAGLMAGNAAAGDITGRDFLRGLYQRNIFPDHVAIHPYSSHSPDEHYDYENNFDDIEVIRGVMQDYGQSDRAIWVTEWGWSTTDVSEDTQAQWLERSLNRIVDQYTYVTVATYFLDRDRSPFRHGIFAEDWRLKPAGERFREVCGAVNSP